MEIESIERIKKLLRDRHWDEALKKLIEVITSITENLNKSNVENNDMIQEFNEIMVIIDQAISSQDIILLCDMVEFELYPFISQYIRLKDDLNEYRNL